VLVLGVCRRSGRAEDVRYPGETSYSVGPIRRRANYDSRVIDTIRAFFRSGAYRDDYAVCGTTGIVSFPVKYSIPALSRIDHFSTPILEDHDLSARLASVAFLSNTREGRQHTTGHLSSKTRSSARTGGSPSSCSK
jgi:hypothetical protein